MANSLFISYDLYNPGQDYEKVAEAIKSLGNWAKVQKSFWYVNSTYTASKAVDKVWSKMDGNDSLVVVDATNKNAAWRNLDEKVSKFIQDHWAK
jgi:predicted P-loop ATPase/GTPase